VSTVAASGEDPAGGDRRLWTRVRLDIAYDGTDFSGWAAQPGRRTVAGVLAETLTRVVGTIEGLTVAGRTDAGVHATGQVSHVDIPAERWSLLGDSLVHRLAGLLPRDVRVPAAVAVPDSFDARFSALYRRYEYRVADVSWGAPPLRHRDTLAWPRSLDLDALNRGSRHLLGEHDFAAYCRRKEQGTTVRAITRLDWTRDEAGIVVATVQADAFCQAMVRSLVGALLTVGDGRHPVDWPGQLLSRRERASEVMVAPPHGLTLVAVGYPSAQAEYAARAEQTRQRRLTA
jgi:tRNA pseudouridine38-40 synthase